jgi:nicotinate-nucleotide--dimethylbenzimidazole phosphoribosyltransferase
MSHVSDPLLDAAAGVDFPDSDAEHAARLRQAELTKPAGSLGRLEDLSVWVCGVQGVCPPRDFQRARVVIFAGDHGVTASGVSAYPAEVTAQMVANFATGGAAVNALSRVAGATVRVVDMSVNADTDPAVSTFKVRRGSGAIDHEDALTDEDVRKAVEAGIAIADQEIDEGADMLIAGDMGIGNTTPASVLISVLTDTEPTKVVGRGTGIDDAGWIRKCAAIRDARRRAWPYRDYPLALLRTAGGADLAAMSSFLLQAAKRRTPVILDGVVVTAAALVAQRAAPRVTRWMQAGHLSADRPHDIALRQLGLSPIVNLGMRLGEGSGALIALPVVHAAVRTLAEMATFGEASVATKSA